MTPKYRAVLFDLDDTLFDQQTHRREGLSALAKSIPELAQTSLRKLEDAHEVHLQRTHGAVLDGSLSVADARMARMRGVLNDFGIKADMALASRCEKIYREAFDREWRAVPGAPELLGSLRNHGIRLAVITNGFGRSRPPNSRNLDWTQWWMT
jgi:phosphoglycolate phosphatase-like HAD superfamily hydrolase